MSDPLLAVLVLSVVVVVLAVAILVSRRNAILVPAAPVAVRVEEIEGRLEAFEEHLKEQDGTLKRQDHELRNIRMSLASMPTKDIVHKMDIELTALGGKVASVDVTTTANGRTLERIENYLLNAKLGQGG